MCDVLFASYLRYLDDKHVFVSIGEKLYNYNILQLYNGQI